jgi:CMP-N-acetylneuraminic acid synthetase
MPKYVGLIPARAGSKGIPNKNTQLLGGLNLVELTVEAAFGAGILDLYLSSDSLDILGHTEAKYPKLKTILRTASAATDKANASDVVLDFLSRNTDLEPEDYLIYLQPTSPFRKSKHILEALDLAQTFSPPRNVVSVVDATPHPSKAVRIVGSRIEIEKGSSPTANRQALPELYFPNGAIYIFSVGDFMDLQDVPVNGSAPFIMDKFSSIDIDSPADLQLARLLWDNEAF